MNARCSPRIWGLSVALLLASAALPAAAHHAASMFDMTKQITLHGTVEKWLWANPHSWLYIRVMKPDGSQEIWGFEGGSTGMAAREGWNAADMKPGDKVAATGAPERNGNHLAILTQVQLASGRVLKAGIGALPPGGPGAPPGAPPPGANTAPPPASR
jgi:hypothetical protein